MELEGDSPAPRHFPTPEPVGTQNIQVTPENVVELAALFGDCADHLQSELRHLATSMRVKQLMADPVSSWVVDELNKYLFDQEHAFVKIVQTDYQQHEAVRDALIATAQRYGLTEQLIAAGFVGLPPK